MLKKPVRRLSAVVEEELKYYNAEVHEAAFQLPTFARRVVEEAKKKN